MAKSSSHFTCQFCIHDLQTRLSFKNQIAESFQMLLLAELILIKQCVCSLSHKTDDCQENNIDIFLCLFIFHIKINLYYGPLSNSRVQRFCWMNLPRNQPTQKIIIQDPGFKYQPLMLAASNEDQTHYFRIMRFACNC